MKISVVVVTWNGLQYLQACIAALRLQTFPHELVIVDNGSSDGSIPWLRQAAPHARIVELPHNLGFAGGNNAGLAIAKGDLIVLINNDTVPPPEFLEELTRPLLQAEDVAVVGGVLTFAHRPDLIASAGIVPGRDGVHRDARLLEPVASLPAAPSEIFGASGGALCVRRCALEDVGYFEERFFNYLEDADLAWRLRLRGYRCVLAPLARLPHIYSATSIHGSPLKRRLLVLNRWRVLLRCMPYALRHDCRSAILRYDLQALVFSLIHRQFEAVQARVEVLRELPILRTEHEHIAARAVGATSDLERWLEAAPSPGAVLSQMRLLDGVLGERSGNL